MKRFFLAFTSAIMCNLAALAQLEYSTSMQGSVSGGEQTPLWLNANKHGLSSLDKTNGYLRAGLFRNVGADSAKTLGWGFGADVVVAGNYDGTFIVQQAYAEGRWLHGSLTVGSKEYPMEMKNQQLSTGSQTLGINARPVPQARLSLNDWAFPGTRQWLHVKGHFGFGMMTDTNWQHDFTRKQSRYTDNVLYHSKAGYLLIGKEGHSRFSAEMGLEMASMFGGDTYAREGVLAHKNQKDLDAFWHASFMGGVDDGEVVYRNVLGDQVGSWVARVNYDADKWQLGVYADHFFEDHSSMFMMEYDGYGTGDDWDKKKKAKFLLYDWKDVMLGAELKLKEGTWLQTVVLEYIYTKYQSGPIYHDHEPTLPDHLGGGDSYYNHGIYPGWQHWGQVIGNPLFRSPVYNESRRISIEDNRFVAWHLGVDGQPLPALRYRVLGTCQTGYGTYGAPYVPPRHNFSCLAEVSYALPHNWGVTGTFGMDRGKLLNGNSTGFQLTITKKGKL